jgi:hypothetical protein
VWVLAKGDQAVKVLDQPRWATFSFSRRVSLAFPPPRHRGYNRGMSDERPYRIIIHGDGSDRLGITRPMAEEEAEYLRAMLLKHFPDSTVELIPQDGNGRS